MSRRKRKDYYKMGEKQFAEMTRFYETLGFSEKQVKLLSQRCFSAEIRLDRHVSYSDNWTFYRQIEFDQPPMESLGNAINRAFRGRNMMASGGAVMMRSASVQKDAFCEMAQPMMGMAAPMASGETGALNMAAMPIPTPEFNTAETHIANENENHSPLDAPQLIFSANVNTASWSYLRSRINRNKTIDKSFVRIEEVINSYPYKLDPPENDDLFSVNAESSKCPWNEEHELLFLGLKGKKVNCDKRQNLAFLVDVSGSMDDEWVLVQMSMAAIISKLKKGDTMSIIAYSDNTTTVVKQLECGDMDKCVDAILSIDGIGGCTNGSEGLENAYKYLKENYDENANNRVFIFTDGDFNFGITAEGGLKDFIYKKRETGIYLSVVGYGERNFKDNKMETLAQNGNGNYTFIGNPHDILDNLWDKLISNLVTVAKDVKISVEFNPAFVEEYRLIGYDARLLTQQEFHDTAKATDGIGSEHNVAALIELKRGEAKKKYSSRYVSVDKSGSSDEFAFVEIHYKSPEGENLVMTKAITLDEITASKSENLPAASALALFGLLVKDSDYKGSGSKELLKKLADDFVYDNDYSHFGVIQHYLES